MDRDYRRLTRTDGLTTFQVTVEQTDLWISAESDLSGQAYDLVHLGRRRIETHGAAHPGFFTAMGPWSGRDPAPPPVSDMIRASGAAGVGPMAAVAGAMAQFVAQGLRERSPGGVVVENGGDAYLIGPGPYTVGLYAGDSELSMTLGLRFDQGRLPVAVCTSSGTVGHSVSHGRADAATVVAGSAALADAAATALGNRVSGAGDIQPALGWALSLDGVIGAVVIVGGQIGLLGDLELVSLD